MPTKCVSEELKQSVIPRRQMWERYELVVIFGLEPLTSSEVRESNKPMGKATNGCHEFDPGGTPKQHF